MSNDVVVKVNTSKNVNVTASIPEPITVQSRQASAIKEVHKVEVFTATAGQTAFPLSFHFKTDSCHVFRNGILQERGVDYIETDSRGEITFSAGQEAGDKIEVMYVID